VDENDGKTGATDEAVESVTTGEASPPATNCSDDVRSPDNANPIQKISGDVRGRV